MYNRKAKINPNLENYESGSKYGKLTTMKKYFGKISSNVETVLGYSSMFSTIPILYDAFSNTNGLLRDLIKKAFYVYSIIRIFDDYSLILTLVTGFFLINERN